MTREDLIRHPFQKTARLIELGASHRPIVPKADGWQTIVIDHTTEDELRKIYRAEEVARIEAVDYVWNGEPLDTLLPESLLGQFDGLIASHVGEHIPDLIGFFQALDRVLKPGGVIALALPDMRVCFDFFLSRTTTGEVLDAHANHRTRHRRGKIFDGVAYRAQRGTGAGWLFAMPPQEGAVQLEHDLATANNAYQTASEAPGDPYTDTHGWQFTPASFQLILLELHQLDLIPWKITRLEQAAGVEFYVWLERSAVRAALEQVQAERLRLLRQTLVETAREHLAQLTEPAPAPPPPAATLPAVVAQPAWTVSAIVPLYNGERFIAGCLDSILAQSRPPIEIIVVDDGSRDAGPAIVDAFQDAHPAINLRLLVKPNGGQSSARNLGAMHANGDLLAFLDQDDRWYSMHLERLVRPFIKPPPGQPLGWVYSNLDEADVDGRIIHHNYLTMLPAPHPKRNLYRCIDSDMFILPSAALISRTVFDQVGGFDERLSGYEDDDLFLRMFQAGHHNVFLNMPLSKWCIHENSASYTPRMRRSRAIYCRKLLERFPDQREKGVFLSRDTILPRFYGHARSEYHAALLAGDLPLIAETMQEIRFILGVAVAGDGINTYMTQRRAMALQQQFAQATPASALAQHQFRRRLQPLTRRIPRKMLLRLARRVALVG